MSHSGFLQAICERPHDLDVRLIYADWLDERADPLGKFIRAQCALSDFATPYCSLVCGQCEKCSLHRREQELLNEHWHDWLSAGGMSHYFATCRNGDTYGWLIKPKHGDGRLIEATFRNGFVFQVSCTQADWIAHGKEIVQAQPIEEVRLTDKEPYRMTGLIDEEWFRWWLSPNNGNFPESEYLEKQLFGVVYPEHALGEPYAIYPTAEEAQLSLSRACVSWARSEAHLPALEER